MGLCFTTFLLLTFRGPFVRSHPGKPNQRKANSWTFPGGKLEPKFDVNRTRFAKEKHQNSKKWAKFMNFSFWPFLWFGLPGRVLTFASHDSSPNSNRKLIEAQQRYFSYRAILVRYYGKSLSCSLIWWGIAQLLRDMLQNGVSHRWVCVKLSTKGGVSHHFGGVLTSLKNYRATRGIAAIVPQYRAMWGH